MKIYIEGTFKGSDYEQMFLEKGFELVQQWADAELVCFTGGADVHPKFYGEEVHPRTYANEARDIQCFTIFNHCVANSIPMVGICRGSQFLCVANGGGLWQHVDGHAVGGSHSARDVKGGYDIEVTSTHHQMMRPEGVEGVDYEILLTANESTQLQRMTAGLLWRNVATKPDVEAVYWQGSKSFGFQPHPEFQGAPESCTNWFFERLNLILE